MVKDGKAEKTPNVIVETKTVNVNGVEKIKPRAGAFARVLNDKGVEIKEKERIAG